MEMKVDEAESRCSFHRTVSANSLFGD